MVQLLLPEQYYTFLELVFFIPPTLPNQNTYGLVWAKQLCGLDSILSSP